MRRAPRRYCIKRRYERARRMELEVLAKLKVVSQNLWEEGQELLDMANKKRNNGRASR
jgi:hypothetical protein